MAQCPPTMTTSEKTTNIRASLVRTVFQSIGDPGCRVNGAEGVVFWTETRRRGPNPTIPVAFKACIRVARQNSGDKESTDGSFICKYRELPSKAYITYVIQMHGGRLLLPMALLMIAAFFRAHAADPHIEKIERFGSSQKEVVIHFETPADRTTALQATGSLRPPTVWTNVFVVPRDRDPSHYVIVHAPNGRCFYRLRITE